MPRSFAYSLHDFCGAEGPASPTSVTPPCAPIDGASGVPQTALRDSSKDVGSCNVAMPIRPMFVQDFAGVPEPFDVLEIVNLCVECPPLRHRMSAYRRNDGLRRVDSVEKLVWLSRTGTAAKFDLIEPPVLNATNAGDGL
jgi:hypothetical protein